MAQLTHTEKLHIIQASLTAADRGDHEEEHRLLAQIPLPPEVAIAFKNTFGTTWLKQMNYDLSIAEAVYGKNWLD